MCLSFVSVTVSSNMSAVSVYTIFAVYTLLYGIAMRLCMQQSSGLQPDVRVPPGVSEDILGVRENTLH
jgi:hypothetical protein